MIAGMNPVYRDPNRLIGERVGDLLGRMTVAQQCAQVVQLVGAVPAWEAPALVRRCGSVLQALGPVADHLQRLALAEPLGIPLLIGIDATHGHGLWPGATVFPSQLGMACTWDEELVRAIARATAVETAATGAHWTFSPVLCRPRDLRWGRVGETFGEDQLLIERLGVAMVRGLQGDDLRRHDAIAACIKHYITYAETVGGRDASDCELSERQIRARLLRPFAAAVRAGAASVMTAYHAIDGVPACSNRRWLREILRDELGFAGMVVTDYDCAGKLMHSQRLTAELATAVRMSLSGGSDLLMGTDCAATIEAGVAAGAIARELVAQACARVLELKFRLGLFEDPRLSAPERITAVMGCEDHRRLARTAAVRSLTLVRNRDRTLPLAPQRLRQVALIGPGADDPIATNGDWSLGTVANQNTGFRAEHPRQATVTIRDGLERRLAADGVRLTVCTGCGDVPPQAGFWNPPSRRPDQGIDHPASFRIAAAVRAAQESDAVVLVLGDPAEWWGEFHCTGTLELPPVQRQLFDAVRATGTPLIAVLLAHKPLAVPWLIAGADATIVAFSPGMETGTALAAVLFGDEEPGGRLPISFPRHVGQLPVAYDSPAVAHHDRYVDDPGLRYDDPLLAFGEGQGYTTFGLRSPRRIDGSLAVTVTNLGERPGSTVVQVYARAPLAPASRPPRWLVAWQRVSLPPGASEEVRIPIPDDRLTVCAADGTWVSPERIELLVGSSSRERDLTVIPWNPQGRAPAQP
jgi:beta-glucosidase